MATGTFMQILEERVRSGLSELEAARPTPRPVWAANRIVATTLHRQQRAERRRPVAPSREGRIAELRLKLYDQR